MDSRTRAEVALIERLLARPEVKESGWWQPLINRFLTAEWIVTTGRKSAWCLAPAAREAVIGRLYDLWPSRDNDLLLLGSRGWSSCEVRHLEMLPSLRAGTPKLPPVLNRRTFFAITGAGPKRLSGTTAESATLQMTTDASTRFRPNQGLTVAIGSAVVDVCDLAREIGEFALPERAFLAGATLRGRLPEYAVTVENLGTFVDMALDDDVLAVYSPGSDLRCAEAMLGLLRERPWIHFGDLDPKGVEIGMALAQLLGRQPNFYVPTFLPDYLDLAQNWDVQWPDTVAPALQPLAALRRGIYQERFTLDERLRRDLREQALGMSYQI